MSDQRTKDYGFIDRKWIRNHQIKKIKNHLSKKAELVLFIHTEKYDEHFSTPKYI